MVTTTMALLREIFLVGITLRTIIRGAVEMFSITIVEAMEIRTLLIIIIAVAIRETSSATTTTHPQIPSAATTTTIPHRTPSLKTTTRTHPIIYSAPTTTVPVIIRGPITTPHRTASSTTTPLETTAVIIFLTVIIIIPLTIMGARTIYLEITVVEGIRAIFLIMGVGGTTTILIIYSRLIDKEITSSLVVTTIMGSSITFSTRTIRTASPIISSETTTLTTIR